MNLSQKQLKQIISEELNSTIEEDRPPDSHVEAALEYFRTKVDPNDENSWKHWEIMAKWFANLGYKIVAEEFNQMKEHYNLPTNEPIPYEDLQNMTPSGILNFVIAVIETNMGHRQGDETGYAELNSAVECLRNLEETLPSEEEG